jgi:hypothetical protein
VKSLAAVELPYTPPLTFNSPRNSIDNQCARELHSMGARKIKPHGSGCRSHLPNDEPGGNQQYQQQEEDESLLVHGGLDSRHLNASLDKS